jgi:glyoxylase-like metal-dependent hydrolase (beta-lactamase superfamily II)
MGEYQIPKGEMTQVGNGLYAFFQNGWVFVNNAGLIIGKDYCIVVDTFTNKYQCESFISEIKKITDKPVKIIINTHWHTDHTFTNHLFPEAITVNTKKTHAALLEAGPNEGEAFAKVLPKEKFNFEGSQISIPDIAFEGEIVLRDGIHEIRVIEMGAGHSVSDCIVMIEKEGVIFLGDIATEGTRGCKRPAANIWSGSYAIINSLHNLLRYPAEKFIPGHGGRVLGRQEMAAIITDLTDFLVIVREECLRLWKEGLNYREAADKFNYQLLQAWSDNPEALYNQVYANCARAWVEFEGNEPEGVAIDVEDVFGIAMLGRNKRLDLGRHDKRRI